MAENYIKVKHGSSVPTTNTQLRPWEMGVSTSNNALYINTGNTTTANIVGYLPLTAGENAALTGNLYIKNSTSLPTIVINDLSNSGCNINLAINSVTKGQIRTPSNGNIFVNTVNSDGTKNSGLYGSAGGAVVIFGGPGACYLRPQGYDSTTGQIYCDTSGNLHFTSTGQQIGGHNRATITGSVSDKSISAATVTNLFSCTGLTSSGEYLIFCCARFEATSTAGWGYLGVSSTSGTTAPGYRQSFTTATARRDVNFADVVTGSSAYYMNFYSSTAGSVSSATFKVVRLS